MNTAQIRIDQSVNRSTQDTNMNYQTIPIVHASPVSFENITLWTRGVSAKLAELKAALVRRFSAEYADIGSRLIYQAINEADALAASTVVPLLVLPTLAEEKVRSAAAWSAHQREIRGAA
jgi:hypothetical protein